MALDTGSTIVDRILTKSAKLGVRVEDDFVRLLAKPLAEVNEFERLLRMPFKSGQSISVRAVTNTLETLGEAKVLTYGEKAAEVSLRLERLKTLSEGLRGFGRASAGGVVLTELAFAVVDLLEDLWWYSNPKPLDPDKWMRTRCAGKLDPVGGIWRGDAAEAAIDAIDAYMTRVNQIWDGIMDKFFVAGIVKQFWRDIRPEYLQSAFTMGAAMQQGAAASRFGEGNPQHTRNGVRPR